MVQICENIVTQPIILQWVYWNKAKRKASAQFCCEDVMHDILVSSSCHRVDLYEGVGHCFALVALGAGAYLGL